MSEYGVPGGPAGGDAASSGRASVHPAVDAAVASLLDEFREPAAADPGAFAAARYDRGLAWLSFARGFGGLGVEPGWQTWVEERLAAAGAPPSPGDFVGLHQAAAALHAFGRDEHKRRFLRPLFTGQEHWCQLFSEPGAGSDLAGLSTVAIRDGHHWILNGQKVWTSGAHHARWGILVARTDPRETKHRGLTFFVCDMHASGVEVRPLRQADGATHFNEVFLTDVRLPDALRLGEEGQGWVVSMVALGSERDGTGQIFSRSLAELLSVGASSAAGRPAGEAARRDELIRLWAEARIGDATRLRLQATADEREAAVFGALVKLAASEHAQRRSGVVAAALGPAAVVGLDYDAILEASDREDMVGLAGLPLPRYVVRARAFSIEGGTSEVQRNIIGERLLGLPPDVRVDKDRPWTEVPRN